MEGLTGVRYISGTRGAVTIELEFLDPPPEVIEVLSYAMLNQLTIDIPAGVITGSLSPFSVVPVSIDLRNETEDIDATTYGSVNPTYIKRVVHRHFTVNARPA
jgi:hypothetical protein